MATYRFEQFSTDLVDPTFNQVSADYIAAPATALKAGTLIRAFDGQKFSGVTLTSGSITLVL